MYPSSSPSSPPRSAGPSSTRRLSPLRSVARPTDDSDEEDNSPRSSTESSPTMTDEEAHPHENDTPETSPDHSHSSPSSSSFPPKATTIPSPKTPTSPTMHPYPRSSTPTSPGSPISPRQRPRALAPLSSLSNSPGQLPRAQPLSRTLFARLANDVPHAGLATSGKKKGGGQKLIVPTKGFRTTFELDLTASEFRRS